MLTRPKTHIYYTILRRGQRVIGISWISDLVKIPMELIFNPCDEFQWSPEGPLSQINSPHLHADILGIFNDLLRSVQILNREWSVESNSKLSHLFIPSKTTTLVPEFVEEDLSLDRTSALIPGFAVKDLPLGRTLMMMMIILRRDGLCNDKIGGH